MAIGAMALFATFMILCGRLRMSLHARRTGDSGDRRRAARQLPAQRGVDALANVGTLGVGVAAPVAALVGLPPVPPLSATAVQIGGVVVAVVAIGAVFAAQQTMGASWRVGLDPAERTTLVTDGVFGLVRNPIMAGAATMFAGLTLMVPNVVALVAYVSLVAAIQLQIRRVEEPHLRAVHGADYQRYAATVGRFVPGLGRLR